MRDARVLPGALEVLPDLRERMRAQVAADERQRVDQLDQPVGEHDQQRGRVVQSVAQLLEQSHLVEMHAHPAAILVGLGVQRLEERFVLRLGRRSRCHVLTALPVYIVRPV